MNDEKQEGAPVCPECFGATVTFRGHGQETQYMVCARYQQPGHMSEGEVKAAVQQKMRREWPSGRYA